MYSNGVAVKEEICWAMEEIDILHKAWSAKDAWYTSIVDGKHKRNSRHYLGLACDLRIWYIDKAYLNDFVDEAKELLGPNYNVLLEKTHIHISFRPTR